VFVFVTGRTGVKNEARQLKVALMKMKMSAVGDNGIPQVRLCCFIFLLYPCINSFIHISAILKMDAHTLTLPLNLLFYTVSLHIVDCFVREENQKTQKKPS